MHDSSIAFSQAINLFNKQQFFECHEVLEDLWRPLPPGDDKTFLQGLIQIAVGLHHLQRRNTVGARNKLQAGLEKLEASYALSPYGSRIDPPRLLAEVRPILALLGKGLPPLEQEQYILPKIQRRSY